MGQSLGSGVMSGPAPGACADATAGPSVTSTPKIKRTASQDVDLSENRQVIVDLTSREWDFGDPMPSGTGVVESQTPANSSWYEVISASILISLNSRASQIIGLTSSLGVVGQKRYSAPAPILSSERRLPKEYLEASERGPGTAPLRGEDQEADESPLGRRRRDRLVARGRRESRPRHETPAAHGRERIGRVDLDITRPVVDGDVRGRREHEGVELGGGGQLEDDLLGERAVPGPPSMGRVWLDQVGGGRLGVFGRALDHPGAAGRREEIVVREDGRRGQQQRECRGQPDPHGPAPLFRPLVRLGRARLRRNLRLERRVVRDAV